MSYPFIIQGANVSVVIDNRAHTINRTHVAYQRVLDAIKAGEWDTVKDLIEPRKAVVRFGAGNVSIDGDTLKWKGQVLDTGLARRMIQMLQEGFSIEPMAAFMENLMQNPSKRAVNELYGFLEKNELPITPDGHFLAYKKVRANFTDVHSGTMDNSVGQVVEMERNQVDDDRNRTCSTGLHFCGQSYLGSFGGERTMIVKINPRDVVSIPSDYNEAKGRACRYEVIGELGVEPERAFDKPVQAAANTPAPAPSSNIKIGSTPFYQGYSDGFRNQEFKMDTFTDWRDEKNYREGYDKGEDDFVRNQPERYRFQESTVPATKPQALDPKASWPFPNQ